jgi:dTDP-4-dehydrorhamnose reductase
VDILVTGGSGQVGLELSRLERPADVVLHAPSRAELDFEQAATIEKAVAARPWAAVINAAAYTAVDRAESEVVAETAPRRGLTSRATRSARSASTAPPRRAASKPCARPTRATSSRAPPGW